MLTLEIIYQRFSIAVLNKTVLSFHLNLNMCTFNVVPVHKKELKIDKKNKSVFFLICPKFMKTNVSTVLWTWFLHQNNAIKIHRIEGQDRELGASLTHLSKACNCIDHYLLLTNLSLYGLNPKSIKNIVFIKSNLQKIFIYL